MSPIRPQLDPNATDQELIDLIREVKTHRSRDPDFAADLAKSLAQSGATISPRGSFSADVASTGGPTSLSTLICPLFLCAVPGALVPKLGVPGRPAGGIDCLAQIPGYQSTLPITRVGEILDDTGYAHFLADESIAPLDIRIFRLRQKIGAQQVPTLVAASLMAKKFAVGVRQAGLDIRVASHGNFGTTWEEAKTNAALCIEVGKRLGIGVAPTLTDGRYPYQPYIGRQEALVALNEVFEGRSDAWLAEHVLLCKALALACCPPALCQSIATAESTSLRKAFVRNLEAQGSSADTFYSMLRKFGTIQRHHLRATASGFVAFDLAGIRDAIVKWQLQCASANPFPDPVGIILCRRPGEWIEQGDTLATVRTDGVPFELVSEELSDKLIGIRSKPASPSMEGL